MSRVIRKAKHHCPPTYSRLMRRRQTTPPMEMQFHVRAPATTRRAPWWRRILAKLT